MNRVKTKFKNLTGLNTAKYNKDKLDNAKKYLYTYLKLLYT